MNNWETSPLNGCVAWMYISRECTGQSFVSSGNLGKKNSVRFFPGRDCFARPLGKNIAPSGETGYPLRFSFERSADREGRDKASNMAVRRERAFSGNLPCNS